MACFADINVSQGSVATYTRCDGIFNIYLSTNLPRSLPVIFFDRLRFDRIMVMSLWPHFLAHVVHAMMRGLTARDLWPLIDSGFLDRPTDSRKDEKSRLNAKSFQSQRRDEPHQMPHSMKNSCISSEHFLRLSDYLLLTPSFCALLAALVWTLCAYKISRCIRYNH